MNKIKKVFFEQDITWMKLIIISVICGLVTGIIPLINIFSRTSIHNIAECFEFWVLIAMFIILNSKRPIEAGLKTFVFFLISQPLCYLVQVPFYTGGFEIFMYYKYWGILTLLTFPGAIIAWFVKKDNWLSVLILSVALLLLNHELCLHFMSLIKSFPYQLLAVLFILFEDFLFINILFNNKIKKIFLYIFILFVVLISFIYTSKDNEENKDFYYVGVYELDKGSYTVFESSDDIIVELNETSLVVRTKIRGEYTFKIKDQNDNIIIFSFKALDANASISRLE